MAYNDYNAMMFPSYHQIFFSALQPDAIIICISPFDDVEFVERTIKAAEGISGGKVIGIVCFPIDASDKWYGNLGVKSRINQNKELEIKNNYKNKFSENLKVFMLDKYNELDELINEIIDYFQ